MTTQPAQSSFPVRTGATCGGCDGPVDGFGCIAKCEESERYRINTEFVGTAEERLAAIGQIAEQHIRAWRPEYATPEMFSIYELVKGRPR